MLRRFAAAVLAAGLLLTASGCYRPEDAGTAAFRAEENTGGARDTAADAQNAVPARSSFTAQPATGADPTAASSTRGQAPASRQTAASSVPRPAATVAVPGEPDLFLLQQCINYNYAYSIVQAVAEGILAPADEALLREELEEYDRLNAAAFPAVNDAQQAQEDAAILLGKAEAGELALTYIEALFEPPADLSAADPQMLELWDYRQEPVRDWLGWETYYEVCYEVPDPQEQGTSLFYSVNVDGRTGELVSGNFARESGRSPEEIVPSDVQIQEMQERARDFVLKKELVPGTSVVYVCSSTWGGASSELQTEVYLSDGTVVDVHEGYEPDTRLYFNLFPTHGFAASAHAAGDS